MAANFHFPPPPKPLFPNGPPQVDFSKIARIADAYYEGQDRQMRQAEHQQRMADNQAAQARDEKLRQAFAGGAPTGSDGEPDYGAMALKLAELGYPEHASNWANLAERRQDRAETRSYRKDLLRQRQQAGQTERIIQNLMEENPNLSYAEAAALARRAPQDDSLRRERLAHDAYKNDMSRSLEEWREFYGLGAPAAPAMPSAPPAPAASALPPSIGQDRTSQFAAPGLGSASPPPAQGADQARQAREAARRAIVQGADRNAVIRRLRAMGVDPTGL